MVDLQKKKPGDILALIVVWHVWQLRREACLSLMTMSLRTHSQIHCFPSALKNKEAVINWCLPALLIHCTCLIGQQEAHRLLSSDIKAAERGFTAAD